MRGAESETGNLMEIPAFSIFSAVSELAVTAVVLYVVVRNLRGRPFEWKLLGAALVFEVCVNVVYMSIRAAETDQASGLSTAMKVLAALHGILSLAMLIGLIGVYILAVVDTKSGRETWFRRNPGLTWAFIGLWLISVGSGEAFFALRYLV